MEIIIQCVDAAFGYEGKAVIEEINFTVQRGDYFCIAGENGAGKSTLIKGILKLISPLRGRLITSELLKTNEIGYLSQQAATKKDFPADVWEIVLSGFLGNIGVRPFYSVKEKETAVSNMKRLGIDHLKNACYRELSGGLQRRVLLARALCASQNLLVLDEPVAGLDPLISAEVYGLLSKLNKEIGVTIIMVTHALDFAVKYANRILHLKNKQIFFGETEAYINSETGRRFLGIGD
ncbi:MAG: metal ABC transporter ATP-binding protein [Spirochaetaceae bacterium]|jgi:zinc transport system ATP-binding protein|nr:metal ABC transporter ATP-binding protein [Spirochaetaceae bacterium]